MVLRETKSPPIDAALEEIKKLRGENERLKSLLKRHGIDWTCSADEERQSVTQKMTQRVSSLSGTEKIQLFKSLFRGRADVFAVRWESSKGKSGYSPSCGNEWRAGICGKPEIKCSDCENRQLNQLTDRVLLDHLTGKLTIGIYPMLSNETCGFLAVDFDEASWREDAAAFLQTCVAYSVPASLEISRSGNGAHVWIFFSEYIPARTARQLGTALISKTCDLTKQLSLSSYDRFFPSQDTLPKGGFGNLIALPLQKSPREQGRSVFVDENMEPAGDQWEYLANVSKMQISDVTSVIAKACNGRSPLDVAYLSTEEDIQKPWERAAHSKRLLSGPLPKSISLVHANLIYVSKICLTQSLRNRLLRIGAFQNPEFCKAQAMRMPVWNKPRVISCVEDHKDYLGIPRGCIDDITDLLKENGIEFNVQDERFFGKPINACFTGELRTDQDRAVKEMLKQDTGVLSAATAFGKTVVAAAIIARRKISTLILVHRTDLLRQWQEKLQTFLKLDGGTPGVIFGGKFKPCGKIDIAVMQSLSRRENLMEFMDGYGQIIIDECHHLPAYTFEKILKHSKARFVSGLTATPVRRDGHHPIIFMQCGKIRHSATRSDEFKAEMRVLPREVVISENLPLEAKIQDLFHLLVNSRERNDLIASDIKSALKEGRKILVLTERTEHLDLLLGAMKGEIENLFILHGRLSKKQRGTIYETLEKLDGETPRVIFATGRLIGEGFDHPPLDTLVIAMPISWKGTLQQYAGRLHRKCAGKKEVRVYDYIERQQPQLYRMWRKRFAGYKAMGYTVYTADTNDDLRLFS